MRTIGAETKLVLSAAWQPQMIFSVVWFGLAILAGIKGVLSNREDLLLESLVCGSLGIGFLAWFRGFKLELNDSHLAYRAPLVRKKAISVNRIQRVVTQRIVLGSKLKSFGYQNIVVESKDGDAASLIINARVFPGEAAIALLNELAKRGVSVTLT